MKALKSYVFERLNEASDAKIAELEKKIDKVEDKADDANEKADDANDKASEAEETITDEKTFRDYAENKFKEVYGDELDEDKMKDIIDGILKDYKEDADNGDWGKLVGVLNKSFGA